ncbi:MAG: SCO family protein [Chitinophagaceae bacterium]
MQKRFTIGTFIALVFAVPIIAYSGYLFLEQRMQKLPVYGKKEMKGGREVEHSIDDFELLNQDGVKKGIKSWEGKIVVADFFFTHCPVVCPKMTANLKRVQQAFNRDEILVNSFSVDPQRDSAGQLRTYAEKFKISLANWQLLTGDKKDIYKLARNSFMIVATDGDGGPDDFIHSEKLVLIDKQRRVRGYYDGTSKKETDQLIYDIKKLQNEK